MWMPKISCFILVSVPVIQYFMDQEKKKNQTQRTDKIYTNSTKIKREYKNQLKMSRLIPLSPCPQH